MIPKEQRLDFYSYSLGRKTLVGHCDERIKEGWVIVQIITKDEFSHYILLNKY